MPRKTKKQRVEEYVVKLQEQQEACDTEMSHVEADRLLCCLMREIGYGRVADAFEKIAKWYA